MANLIKKAKKIIAGASMIALGAIANVDASENNISPEERARIERDAERMFNELDNRVKDQAKKQTKRPASQASSNEEKLVRDGLRELELEEQFKKSPFLYQQYNGYIDRYIKVAKTLTSAELEEVKKAVASLDKKLFKNLCESSIGAVYNSEFIFDEEIKNGERHLVYNRESYILCGPREGDFVEVFRFSREHCDSNTPICYPHEFGADVVCSCHGDVAFDEDIETIMRLLGDRPVSSLNKAKDKKSAMIQNKLYVNGR